MGGCPLAVALAISHFPHCTVSYLGIAGVADTLIETNRWDVNEMDGAGMTPLIWVARYGHEGVARLLLQEEDIHPDQKVLLECDDVNPNSRDFDGRTPLSYATMMRREGVVKLLSDARNSNSKPLETPNQLRLYVALKILATISAFGASLEFPFDF